MRESISSHFAAPPAQQGRSPPRPTTPSYPRRRVSRTPTTCHQHKSAIPTRPALTLTLSLRAREEYRLAGCRRFPWAQGLPIVLCSYPGKAVASHRTPEETVLHTLASSRPCGFALCVFSGFAAKHGVPATPRAALGCSDPGSEMPVPFVGLVLFVVGRDASRIPGQAPD